jgi:RimJ/RimL family protein N-acetyltransferase
MTLSAFHRLEVKRTVALRPARQADFLTLCTGPLPCRVRAIAGEIGGKVIGIGGLAYWPDGTIMAFLQKDDNAGRYPLTLHRAALMILAEARRLRIPRITAIADDNVEPARRWLERLGFEPTTIDGQEVWIWSLPSRSD